MQVLVNPVNTIKLPIISPAMSPSWNAALQTLKR